MPLNRERRWPVAFALIAVGIVHGALPTSVSPMPFWSLTLMVTALEIPALLAHRSGANRVANRFGLAGNIVVTIFLVLSIVTLVVQAIRHAREPLDLLQAAALLWVANVLVFASWYWRLDAGGPVGRDREPGHETGAFLFPQMTLEANKLPRGQKLWSPLFVDYLFLAFNTSTAFSPTDVPVLSRWAKVLVMIQSLLSLILVAVLIGRAVNAL